MNTFITFGITVVALVALVQSGYVDLNNGHGDQVSYGFEQSHGGLSAYAGGDHDHDNHAVDYHAEPKYSFNYAVHDPHTGDVKQHVEERDGHVVKGSYSLKEADGSTRIVEYHADKHNGFNAKVHKIAADPHAQNNGHNHYNY